ncbi:MAG: hypothetical protein Q8K36_00950 [Alphaproteobacteria bacterium]|nr:hypothetical protein [Alphaproteobacteria bacterium]
MTTFGYSATNNLFYDESMHGQMSVITAPGQGSFNIVTLRHDPNKRPICILFDVGISADKRHIKCAEASDFVPVFVPKFIGTQSAELHQTSSMPSTPLKKSPKSESVQESRQPLASCAINTPTPKKMSLMQKSEMNTPSSLQKEAVRLDTPKAMEKLIGEINPAYLIIHTSHCDHDHINALHVLPDVPTIFLLGGMHKNKKQKQYFQNFVSSRASTHVFWTYEMAEVCNIPYGSFLTQKLNIQNLNHFSFVKSIGVISMLNNIHIWSLNPKMKDHNSQSYIMSVTLPKADLSLVFCGDATKRTFDHFKKQLTSSVAQSGLKNDLIRRKDHKSSRMVILYLPHHGSAEDFPYDAIDLFKPNAYAVSSGNGSQYGHPRSDLIKTLELLTGEMYVKHFWKRYNKGQTSTLCTFFPTKIRGADKRYLPQMRKNRVGALPVIGTNTDGAIMITDMGTICRQNTHEIEINGQFFEKELKRRAFESPFNAAIDFKGAQIKNFGQIFESEEGHYFTQLNGVITAIIYRSDKTNKLLGYGVKPLVPQHKEYMYDPSTPHSTIRTLNFL